MRKCKIVLPKVPPSGLKVSGVNFFSLAPLANFVTTPLSKLQRHPWECRIERDGEGGKGERKEAVAGERGGRGGVRGK